MSDGPDPLKTCSVCREIKPLLAFTARTKNKDGHTSRRRACVNAANKRRYTERPEHARARLTFFNRKLKDDKAELVFDYLKEHPCVDCGEADPAGQAGQKAGYCKNDRKSLFVGEHPEGDHQVRRSLRQLPPAENLPAVRPPS